MVVRNPRRSSEEPFYGALSRQVLDVSLRVRRGERIWINGWDHTIDLVSALAAESRKRGCRPVTTTQHEAEWLFRLRKGPRSALARMSSEQLALLEDSESYIFTLGPRSPVAWSKIPADRRKLATIWLLEDNDFVKEWKKVSRRNRVKMVGIEASLATAERAESLGLDPATWRRMMFDACLLDYRDLSRRVRRLYRFLKGDAEVRIRTPGGTDLRLRLAGRTPEFSDGLATEQVAKDGGVVFLPPGSVGTTVDERSAEGKVAYDNPIRFPEGRVERLTLRLESGRVESYGAHSGAGAIRSVLRETRGDVDRISYFGIGLNPKMRLGYTMDDRVLGSVELNFGANQHRGGRNKGDRNWWGTVKRASIIVGGHKVMEDGRLLV